MGPPVQSDRDWDVPLDCRLIFLSAPLPFSVLPLHSKKERSPGCPNFFFFFNGRPEVARPPVTAVRHTEGWHDASWWRRLVGTRSRGLRQRTGKQASTSICDHSSCHHHIRLLGKSLLEEAGSVLPRTLPPVALPPERLGSSTSQICRLGIWREQHIAYGTPNSCWEGRCVCSEANEGLGMGGQHVVPRGILFLTGPRLSRAPFAFRGLFPG